MNKVSTGPALVQFQCEDDDTLFYFQDLPEAAPDLIRWCPVCGSENVVATGRTFPPVEEE